MCVCVCVCVCVYTPGPDKESLVPKQAPAGGLCRVPSGGGKGVSDRGAPACGRPSLPLAALAVYDYECRVHSCSHLPCSPWGGETEGMGLWI